MGSIPLPALSIQPPAQQPNMLENLMRLQQLKQSQAMMPGQLQAQQQSLQAGQLENQQRQQQLKDQQAHTAAMNQWDVKSDPNGETLPQLILKNGGSGDAAMSLKKGILAQKEQISTIAKNDAETGQNNLKTLQGKNDINLGALKTIDDVPDDQLGAHLTQTIQGLTQQGTIDPQHAQSFQQLAQAVQSGQVPPATARAQLKILEKGLQSSSQQMTQAKDAAETAKNNAQAGEATANTGKLQAELNFYQKSGLAAGVPLDAQEASDWINKNPGKGPADFAKFKAGLSAQANASAQAGLLTDSAKQMAAQNYAQTGQLPPGMRSPTMAAQVLNTAATGPNGVPNVAANKMNYKADSGSLASLQKNFDQVTAFENTAGKNLDVFLGQAQKVIDSGNPLINRPLRSITGNMGGTDQAAFDAARTTALTEISKVLNSSNASGVLSDSARHEVADLIKPNATLQQIVSAANILKTDMANRHESYQNQINTIKGRSTTGQPAQNAAPTAPAKVLTSSQIQQAAKDHGVSVDEATRQAKAAGYTIQ